MRRALRLLALALAVLATTPGVGGATDGPPWPSAAEVRYGEARRLMQGGHYAEAAAAYRAVAEWPDGGPFPERAQALFLAALMQENAHDYDGALATYQEVARRFPDTPFAVKAEAGGAALAQGGAARGIDFRRRLDAAWGELFPAQDFVESDGIAAARPGLERAVALLTALLHDHADHPRARDVALSLGDAHMTLGLYREARADYERALALIRAQGPTEADAELLQGIEHKRSEAIEAGREFWITGSAYALLVAIFVGMLALRPWRAPFAWMLRPGVALLATTFALGGTAMLLAQWIHDNVDDHSPIETTLAALLVVVPGLTGQLVAFGYSNALGNRGLRNRPAWRTGLAGVLGVVAALAVVTCLVEASGIFAVLGSDF